MTPDPAAVVADVTEHERQAATAFRHGAAIEEIAALLGVSCVDAEDWLDSDRLGEVCRALREQDQPRRGRPRRKDRKQTP